MFMSQAPATKTTTTPAHAPTTATAGASAKPDDKPATTPATTPAAAQAAVNAAAGAAAAGAAKAKGSSKIFIATGPVYEFDTTAKAEKFLNGGDENPAPADYVALRGKRIGTSKKVSLR